MLRCGFNACQGQRWQIKTGSKFLDKLHIKNHGVTIIERTSYAACVPAILIEFVIAEVGIIQGAGSLSSSIRHQRQRQ